MQSIQIFNRGPVIFVVTCFYLSFIMPQLLLSRTELTKHISSILIYSCNHIICPGLSILFSYAPAHKAWIFEKFVFELEAFSCDFKIDCILVCQLISLNKKMVVSSGKLKIFKSWSHICTPLILVSASIKLQVLYSRHKTLRVDTPNVLLPFLW